MHTFRADQLRQGDRRLNGYFVEDAITITDLGLTWVHWFTGLSSVTVIYASGDLIDEVRR